MKLKLTIDNYAFTVRMLNQTTIDNDNLNQIDYASFKELRKLLLSVVTKNLEYAYSSKEFTKQIPDSYGLLFFNTFNGINIIGYENVVIQQICKQIELQLYKTGKYKFDNPRQLKL